jgi:amino acid transporter
LASTAIAGNDILSSCLYVCGIAALFAGVWAPLIFVAIAGVLYLYKHVYTEVVEALPLNGGAYNCLLNATSKTLAAVAGIMTTLSYVATSVISAKTASAYLHAILPGLPVIPMTAGIIIFFAILVIAGVRDSARLAKLIFLFHIFVLTILISTGVMFIINTGWGWLPASFTTTQKLFADNGAVKMLFLAFAASLLGVSGFESSANFVEEQRPGVFRKTLRNMLLGVLLFNPLITIVVLQALPLTTIWGAKDFLLAETAYALGGNALKYLVVTDAFLVLSGAVLASFVGAAGLLYRMTLDHCLPTTIFLPHLRRRNQNANRLIIGFAVLCLSILALTGGSLLSLAGVYTISFLGVMTAFAIGNMILRETRPDLRRPYQGPLAYVVLAATATTVGIIGNILIDPRNILFFSIYFFPALFLVMGMIYRDYILEALLHFTNRFPWLQSQIHQWLEHVIRPRILLFAHHPHKLYRSLEYIRRNETSRRITVIYCREDGDDNHTLMKEFKEYIDVFKRAQVFKNLELSFEVADEAFGPDLVQAYAQRFHLHRNYIFIGTIHDSHSFSFEELGGVRIIQ